MSLDSKEKTKIFSPKLVNGEIYSITINPSEQYPLKKSRYLDVYSSLMTLFNKHNILKYIKHVELNTEVSYPMKNGLDKQRPANVISRIHYHGTICFKDIIGFFVYVQPYLSAYCIYEIDTIDNPQTWNNYMCKDINEWTEREQEPFTTYQINTTILSEKKRKRRTLNEREHDIPIRDDDNLIYYFE